MPTSKSFPASVALLISMYFPPEPGGGANTAWNRALILHKLGYKVFVLCAFPSYPLGKITESKYKRKFFYVERADHFTLIRLRLLPIESKGYVRRILLFINFILLTLIWMPKILRISPATELVYALAPILFSSMIGYIYSKVSKSFFIYEVSAFWPEELVAFENHTYFIIFFFGRIFAKISYILPDMIIVISNFAAQYIADNYHPNVQIYAMPIGVDPNRYPTRTKDSSRKELIKKNIWPAVLDNKFIVLYAGVITKVTKVDNVVYAANKLKHQHDIAFVVIGEGEEKENLEAIMTRYNLNNLLLLPFQESDLVPFIMSAADVCVVPLSSDPIYETTLPTKFFDHLACFKPQIGICTGELAKIINSNKIGLTVKDGETDKLVQGILTLKNSPSLIQSMEKNSHAVLESFSLDTLASKLGNVLQKEFLRRKDGKLKH